VALEPIARNAAVAEAGIDVAVSPSASLGVSYAGQFGDGVLQNGFNVVLQMTF